MLSMVKIFGVSVQATDGNLGKIVDLYFDDDLWVVRYLVVELGNWLSGKQVLLSPYSVKAISYDSVICNLTREQIRSSPDIDTTKPVTRRYEEEIHRYFAWPYYWDYDTTRHPETSRENLAPIDQDSPASEEERRGDIPSGTESSQHLQSVKEAQGYHLQTSDGEVGHIQDFLLQADQWKIRYLVIDTRNWIPGKKVILPVSAVTLFNWEGAQIETGQSSQKIRSAPAFHYSEPVDKQYERMIHQFYNINPYWKKSG